MDFKTLLEMHKAGIGSVRCNADGTYTFGYNKASQITLSKADSQKLMKNLGWEKVATTYDKAASHMSRIVTRIAANCEDQNHFIVAFEHSNIADTTKNVWRTKLKFKNGKSFTIIEGITGLGGKYAVMSSDDSFTKAEGFSKIDDAIRYIFENASDTSLYSYFTDDELEEMAKNQNDAESAKKAMSVLSARKKEVIKEDTKETNREASAMARKAMENSIQEVKDITSWLY